MASTPCANTARSVQRFVQPQRSDRTHRELHRSTARLTSGLTGVTEPISRAAPGVRSMATTRRQRATRRNNERRTAGMARTADFHSVNRVTVSEHTLRRHHHPTAESNEPARRAEWPARRALHASRRNRHRPCPCGSGADAAAGARRTSSGWETCRSRPAQHFAQPCLAQPKAALYVDQRCEK